MRAFMAVRLEPRLQATIAAWQRGLRTAGADARWAPDHQLHFTLKFFADISPEEAAALADSLAPVLSAFPRFDLALLGAGAFPDLARPRVFWAGVGTGRDRLVALADAVEAESGRLGLPREPRAFQPHLTLARPRGTFDAALAARTLTDTLETVPARQTVREVYLVRSTLTPRGAVHEDVARIGLGRPGARG